MFVWVGKEADDAIVIGRLVSPGRVASVLAELRLYWPSCSMSAEFAAHMIKTVFAI